MSMIVLAIAAQLSAPVPVKPDAWFTEGDIPAFLDLKYRAKGLTKVDYGVMVAPDGTAQNCFVEQSSGNLDVDRHVCGVVIRDASGRPAYGVHRDTVEWFNGDGEPPAPKAGRPLDLTVAALPPKTPSPAEVRVTLAVDQRGIPTSCRAGGGSGDTALIRSACGQLLRTYSAVPARDSSGAPVTSVQSAVVRFFKG
jgi:hypothetical protein